MNSEYKYEVRGYRFKGDVQSGSQTEIGLDTVKESKERAKRVLSESEMQSTESSQPLGYSQVVNRFTGECVADFFNDAICQNCGFWFRRGVTGHERLSHNCGGAS